MTGTAYRPDAPAPTLLDRLALPICCGIVAIVCAVLTAAALGCWP